jgi:hypothetical protein
MTQATEQGCTIFPPVPAFYNRPQTIGDMVDATCGRILARIGIPNEHFSEWLGVGKQSTINREQSAVNETVHPRAAGQRVEIGNQMGKIKD